MRTKIQKWGNSLGVRLPKSIRDASALESGTEVEVVVEKNKIVIEPTTLDRRQKLEKMLSQVKTDNQHGESDWGSPRGNEVW